MAQNNYLVNSIAVLKAFRTFSTKPKKSVSLKKWRREWFYYIDHKGMLFLEETEPKNYTSCLKDDRFLVSKQYVVEA